MTDDEVSTLGFSDPVQIRETASRNPGSYWHIGIEPNRFGFMTGNRFAPVYKYFHTLITLADPTARIVGPAVLNWDFTCVGCEGYQRGEVWFEEFIMAYENKFGAKPPAYAWSIDAYPLDWTRIPNSGLHTSIVTEQIEGMRQYLDTVPEYRETPIWIPEIGAHVGYGGWRWDPLLGRIVPVGPYRWSEMSQYLIDTLDWLQENALSLNVEKWFWHTTWRDLVNTGSDGYMGLIFFDGPTHGASLNCLGEIYRARSLSQGRWMCDVEGGTVMDN